MTHNNSNVSVNNAQDKTQQSLSIKELLAEAQKEINDLKMKIMWMERNYE
ncbi:hypothetical protein [Alteromonas sp. A079]